MFVNVAITSFEPGAISVAHKGLILFFEEEGAYNMLELTCLACCISRILLIVLLTA